MDSFNGKIYVHAPLDRETTPTYHLKIKAFDTPTQIANQRSSFIFVNVTLTDVNDNKPVFKTSSYYAAIKETAGCLLYTSPSPRDRQKSRMPSSA